MKPSYFWLNYGPMLNSNRFYEALQRIVQTSQTQQKLAWTMELRQCLVKWYGRQTKHSHNVFFTIFLALVARLKVLKVCCVLCKNVCPIVVVHTFHHWQSIQGPRGQNQLLKPNGESKEARESISFFLEATKILEDHSHNKLFQNGLLSQCFYNFCVVARASSLWSQCKAFNE